MKFIGLTPGYTINRGGESLTADIRGEIETDNKEVIEILTNLGYAETQKETVKAKRK